MNLTSCGGILTPQIEALFKSVHECMQKLDEAWNAGLPQCPKLTETLTRIGLEGEGDKGDGNNNVTERLAADKQIGKPEFIEVTPTKRLETADKIKCQDQNCLVLFSSHGAMKSHFIKRHPDQVYVQPPKVKNPESGRVASGMKRKDKVRELHVKTVINPNPSRYAVEFVALPRLTTEAG